MGENKLDKNDAADLTDTTASKVSEAWHEARDNAEEAGELERGSEPGKTEPQEIQSLDDMKEVESGIDETKD
jgi:hypothetical protein